MNSKKICFVFLIVGVLLGLMMLSVGIGHNPQGEFIDLDTGEIDYLHSFIIFFSWFFVIFLGGCLLTVMIKILAYIKKQRRL